MPPRLGFAPRFCVGLGGGEGESLKGNDWFWDAGMFRRRRRNATPLKSISPPPLLSPQRVWSTDTTPRRGDAQFNAARLDHGSPPWCQRAGGPPASLPPPSCMAPPVSTHNGPSVWSGDKRPSVLLVPTVTGGGGGAEISMSITGQNCGPRVGTAGPPPPLCPLWVSPLRQESPGGLRHRDNWAVRGRRVVVLRREKGGVGVGPPKRLWCF